MPEHRTRSHLAVVVAVGLAVLVVAAASWTWYENRDGDQATNAPAAAQHEPAAPDCGSARREPVGDAGAHIDDAPINYPSTPPAFGDHRSRWEVRAASFYDVDDRPDVAVLIHNLEHGYNILWYDQTVIEDSHALARVREIADGYATLDREPDPETAFIAAPWTADDGGAFPDGMHYALTHWYADPTDRAGSRADEAGITRYCSGISASTVQEWMDDYPLSDAPEGFPDLM